VEDTALSAANDLLAVIQKALDRKAEDAKGWSSARQLAKEWGVSVAHASRRLRDGVEAGAIERRAFRVTTGRGLYPVPHYRAKK
jgi:DNA-binding Lrp family transcriptional regulator